MIIVYIALGIIGVVIFISIMGAVLKKKSPDKIDKQKQFEFEQANFHEIKIKANKKVQVTGKLPSVKQREKKPLPTVKQLLKGIVTLSDFNKLKADFKRAEKSFENSDYDNPRLEKKHNVYEEAYYAAEDIILFKQFVPNLDLESSESDLENAFNIVEISKLDEKQKASIEENSDWVDISIVDYLEKNLEIKPAYFDSILNYQKIINNPTTTFEEKANLITEFAKKNKSFAKEFFWYIKTSEIGKEWTYWRIRST